MIKAWAQTRGMMATFMAKVSEKWPGRSGHIHISVASDGDNAFHDRDRFRSISKQMSQFIGRQLKYMSDFCVLAAPNFNSYKRLVPGCWAPACPIGADMNPYLALSCAIGSGILGIEEDAALRASIVGDASEKTCHTSADFRKAYQRRHTGLHGLQSPGMSLETCLLKPFLARAVGNGNPFNIVLPTFNVSGASRSPSVSSMLLQWFVMSA